MKTNKVTKLGISLLSVAALGVVAPALTDMPVLGATVVKAEEQEPIKYRITYYDIETREILGQMTGVINPGQTINIYKKFNGHEIISKDEWMPNYILTWDIVNEFFYGSADGYNDLRLEYKKLDADAKPSDTSKPEVKPEPKPSETPKPEVKPEPKPSETPKPEVKPETKPSETPKPEVKPSEKPDAEEQKPVKYRISYYDRETGEEIAAEKTGVLNPGETVNIYKDIDGYEIVSKISWMPGYNTTYEIASVYFHGDPDGYRGMYLDYKKLNTDVKPSEETKPDVKPSEQPKQEAKPEPKSSETPKPEVKPSEKPEAEEQEPIKYRIRYLDEHSREIASMETGVLNPGESINIHKDIEGYQVVSNYSWMPGYNLTHDIASIYFYGAADGYREGYLRYKKLDADVKPSEETKPDVKPSEQPKQEAKPEPKPSETPKPEVKPETKPSETPKPEVKPETKPSETPTPEVKPETNPSDTPKPEVTPEPKPSETPKPEVKPSEKPVAKPETSKPTTKPQTGLNNAPTAPINPVGQDSNTKADKPVSKTETTALPNTGEQNSILGFAGFLLASLGLAGLTYKGRH